MKRALLRAVVPLLGFLLIRLLYLTLRIRLVAPSLPTTDKPHIYAFWHGELLLAPLCYHMISPLKNVAVIASHHFDGDLIAQTIRFLGVRSLRGSSRKGAVKVLAEALRWVKEGKDLAITPDGPRGPRHTIADGIIGIAQKTRTPIIVYNILPQNYWQLGSWDKFMIPKPFTRVDYYVYAPLDVSDMSFEEAKIALYSQMMTHAVP